MAFAGARSGGVVAPLRDDVRRRVSPAGKVEKTGGDMCVYQRGLRCVHGRRRCWSCRCARCYWESVFRRVTLWGTMPVLVVLLLVLWRTG